MQNILQLANIHETDSKVPYMLDNKGEKVYFNTPSEFFLNSQCLFIEYTDIIKSPYFILLFIIMRNQDAFSKMFEVERFSGFDEGMLSEWYLQRKHQNPLVDLLRDEFVGKISNEELDKFANDRIIEIPEIITGSPLLNMVTAIDQITIGKDELVKKVVIYYPFDNEVIERDIDDNISDKIEFMSGDLIEAIKSVPKDSTFIFSDVTNISLLDELGCLTYNSIAIPTDYRYNYVTDDKMKLNIEEYMKENIFKVHFFPASFKPEKNEN